MKQKHAIQMNQLDPNQKIQRLANCVEFALNYLHTKSGSSMFRWKPDGTAEIMSWTQDFCDALEECGYPKIDREALAISRLPKSQRKKALKGKLRK